MKGEEKTPVTGVPSGEAGRDASVSGRLEALLRALPARYRWAEVEREVLRRIEEVPLVEETMVAGWLWWLFAASMLGAVAMGWLKLVPHLGGRAILDRVLPAAGTSLMIVSALGLVWAASGGVRPRRSGERFRPGVRWLMVAAGWSAALAGTIVAVLPLASARALPGGLIPLLILLAVSGLLAGAALEVWHERDTLALPADALPRRLALVLGVLLAACGVLLEVWFVLFRLPR